MNPLEISMMSKPSSLHSSMYFSTAAGALGQHVFDKAPGRDHDVMAMALSRSIP